MTSGRETGTDRWESVARRAGDEKMQKNIKGGKQKQKHSEHNGCKRAHY